MTKTSWLVADGLAKPTTTPASQPSQSTQTQKSDAQKALTFLRTQPHTPPSRPHRSPMTRPVSPSSADAAAITFHPNTAKISYNTQRCEHAHLSSGCRIKLYPKDNIRRHEGKPAQSTSHSCFACCLCQHKITMKGKVRAPLLLVVANNRILCLDKVCQTCGTAGK